MSVEKERSDFEAWAETRFYRLRRKGNDYHDTQARIAWNAWLARAERDRGDLPKLMELPEGKTDA